MIFKETFKKTSVAGTVSWNTQDYRGILRLLLIKATTQYDFKMVDENDIVAYHEEGLDLTHRDSTPIGLWGIYTATIENVVIDGDFVITFIYEELRR